MTASIFKNHRCINARVYKVGLIARRKLWLPSFTQQSDDSQGAWNPNESEIDIWLGVRLPTQISNHFRGFLSDISLNITPMTHRLIVLAFPGWSTERSQHTLKTHRALIVFGPWGYKIDSVPAFSFLTLQSFPREPLSHCSYLSLPQFPGFIEAHHHVSASGFLYSLRWTHRGLSPDIHCDPNSPVGDRYGHHGSLEELAGWSIPSPDLTCPGCRRWRQ